MPTGHRTGSDKQYLCNPTHGAERVDRRANMTATTEPETYDTEQLAELFQCSTRHVQNLVSRRVLPEPIRLGALVRWDRTTIRRWLAEGGNTAAHTGRQVRG